MLKTGKIVLLASLFVGLFGFANVVHAQSDITVSASVSETQVFTGERLNLVIQVSGTTFRNVGRPELPSSIPGFRIVSLQPSTSTNYSIVNGVASRSYSYSYSMVAESSGTYVIPSMGLSVDGENYRTAPVSVTVVDRTTSASRAGAERPDVFVRLEVSDQRPVVGQQVITELVLYFKTPLEVVSYQTSNNWSTDGFWKESLSDGSTPRAESVILDGERYRKAVLLRHALFASRSGALKLSPAKLTTTIRNTSRYSDPFSSFFGGFGTNQRTVELSTEEVTINVRPIPDPDNAKNINAVGNFTITRRVIPENATIGEAIEVITEIRGNGNLALISNPGYTFPEGFEIFQPQENLNLSKSESGVGGSKIFRDILIARRAGAFDLPAEQIAYYDPTRRRNITITLPKLSLNVKRDENALVTTAIQRELGVSPVVGVVTWTRPQQRALWANWWIWVALLAPFILIAYSYRIKQENDRLNNDENYARRTRALERAEARFAKATQIADLANPDVKSCMGLLHQTIYGAVGDRLGLQEASFNDEKVLSLLEENNFPDAHLRDAQKMLNKCSTIRFAPVIGRENLSYEIERARAIVAKICEVL
jgi:hypothetical protein